MKLTKTLTTLLTFGFIFAFVFSSEKTNTKAEITIGTASIEQIFLSKNDFTPFLGTVERIQKRNNEIDYIKVKNSDGDVINFKNGSDTLINEDIEVGDEITVFYNKNLSNVAIFPLQKLAIAVVNKTSDELVFLSNFNHNLISSDKSLKLNIGDETKIVDSKNNKYDGTLTNRDLVVYYNFATKSIPAQTTPTKIIVLNPVGNGDNNFYNTASSYLNFNTTIKGIKIVDDKVNYIVNENGIEATLVTDKETYFADKKPLAKNDEVIAFIDSTAPSLGVYPPKYNVSAISKKIDGFIKADSFDKNLVSRDNNLKLNTAGYNDIQITDKKGEPYTGALENKKLLVFYKGASRSIPPETAPDRIVVLGNADNFDISNIKFNDLNGKITKIENSLAKNDDEKSLKLFLTNDNENENIFIVDKDTHILNDYSPKVGDKVVVNTNLAPSILSYPPQYSALTIARANAGDNFVKTTVFDSDNLSLDKKLKINVTDDTKIVTRDGKDYTDDFKNKLVAVEYKLTTRSLPPIATPIKITIINESDKLNNDVQNIFEKAAARTTARATSKVNTISINDKVLTSDDYYIDDNGTIMVKLRSLAGAIDKDLEWIKETETSIVDGNIKVNFDQSYFSKDNKTVKLDDKVVLKDGSTFVPSDFFTKAFDYKIKEKDGVIEITK